MAQVSLWRVASPGESQEAENQLKAAIVDEARTMQVRMKVVSEEGGVTRLYEWLDEVKGGIQDYFQLSSLGEQPCLA